jgi:hypothetical protein
MANYVYVDGHGNEIRREPKGRGRVRSGAQQREDGDWYIVEQPDPLDKPEESILRAIFGQPETKVTVVEDDKTEAADEVVEGRPNQIFNASKPVTMGELLSYFFRSDNDIRDDGTVIQIERVAVIGHPPIEGLKFNACWSRVQVDRKANEVRVWPNPVFNIPPKYVIRGALVQESTL